MAETILVVDADLSSRQSIHSSMGSFYRIIETQGCDETYIYLMKNHFQTKLIFVGIDPLRVNQYDLLMRINRNSALGQIPVICIGKEHQTKDERRKDTREVIQHGAIDYMEPPLDEETLYYRVINLIRMRNRASVVNILQGDNSWRGYSIDSSKGTFWNPSSLDALVMRSYVGAACIIEMNRESITILRTNNRFYKEIYGQELAVKHVLSIDLARYLDAKNSKILIDTLNRSTTENEEEMCELVLQGLEGINQSIHMHVAVKMIDYIDSRRLYYCTFRNDTEQFEAFRRERALMNQLQMIIQNVNVGIIASCMEDGEVKYIYENNQLGEMFGYTEEEFKNLPGRVFQLLLPEYQKMLKELVMADYRRNDIRQSELCARKKDGNGPCVGCGISRRLPVFCPECCLI